MCFHSDLLTGLVLICLHVLVWSRERFIAGLIKENGELELNKAKNKQPNCQKVLAKHF